MGVGRMKWVVLGVGLIFGAGGVGANNLSVTNVTMVPRDSSTTYIEFDLSWSNSWRIHEHQPRRGVGIFQVSTGRRRRPGTHSGMLETVRGTNPAGTSRQEREPVSN
jgi:hypothetical protein